MDVFGMGNRRMKPDGRGLNSPSRLAYAVFALHFAVFAALIVFAAAYKYSHTFSPTRWTDNPGERVKMVGDMLRRHELSAKTRHYVTWLLGEGDRAGYGEPGSLVFYLGRERAVISIDSEWLVISFADGVVSDYAIVRD